MMGFCLQEFTFWVLVTNI